ncbi:DUF7878 domain-containing protein [Planococcus wigleyi]|uniref:DUF7878 domain-containing protein n=1 Tax=Planococcus wigleyi TaxID=2762216 RepID=A0ABR8WBY7_9BACL|nr:hypothetical protein [Planococcus wigleyi]MBD8014514.1 hypothetical protein [Planococcus wigleyi]
MTSLAIHFAVDPILTLDKKLVRQKNGKLLIDVQGELKIMFEESCFFHEPSLALLELGVSLKKWRTRDPGATESFYYFTMEHDEKEGPILAFIQKSEDEWQLFSIWQEFEHQETISLNVLLGAVDQYLSELEELLMNRSRIRYSDFAKV